MSFQCSKCSKCSKCSRFIPAIATRLLSCVLCTVHSKCEIEAEKLAELRPSRRSAVPNAPDGQTLWWTSTRGLKFAEPLEVFQGVQNVLRMFRVCTSCVCGGEIHLRPALNHQASKECDWEEPSDSVSWCVEMPDRVILGPHCPAICRSWVPLKCLEAVTLHCAACQLGAKDLSGCLPKPRYQVDLRDHFDSLSIVEWSSKVGQHTYTQRRII